MKEDTSIANDHNDPETRSGSDRLKESLFDHMKLGVWDFYIMRNRLLPYLPTSWKIEGYAQVWKDLPYLWRTLHDIGTVAWPLLLLYLAITVVKSLIPALSLWYVASFSFLESGRRLQIFKGFLHRSLE